MKKFFSAILLMTMMVFSVGTFVSCNDLVDEMQGIQGQVDGQQAAIKALNDEIAVLESALATAQSTADAAKKAAADAQAAADKAQAEAEAAKAAAAQAKADAIADAKAQVEALKSAYEGKIAEIEATLAGKVGQEEIDAAVKAATDGVNAALEVINTKLATIEATIKDLQDKKADKAELDAEVAKLLEADTKINTQLAALENYIKNLEVGGSANASQIDSIRTELANAAAEIEDLWAELKDENTGLFALVAGNASAIAAMQEDFQAALDELYADIYGEGPNSLFTMVGQHAGLIQDLDERMTAAEEAILANNQALSIAVAIANQIQSVVYVPTDDNINAMSYQLVANENTLISKTYESPLMIMATYEVSPKSLVETLDDSNVGFATVATKVAGAEYFPAKIVDRDATTGRMIVVGYIDEDSDAYTALTTGTQGAVAKIAFNLNVSVSAVFNVEDEDGLQSSINAGTFKVSEYVKAKFATTGKDLLNNVLNGYTIKGKTYYASKYYYENKVPYSPVGDVTAKLMFPNYAGLFVDFEGTYLSLDDASDVLGFDLVPEYGEFKATYYIGEDRTDLKNKLPYGKTSPIVVSGENFETVATLVGSTDYPEEKALHHNVFVEVDGVKLNGAPLTNVNISALYLVDYKKADITLTSTDITWSYKFGASLDGTEWPELYEATELDVVGFDDITALYTDPDCTTQFAPSTANNHEFVPTSITDSKGNQIPVTDQFINIVSLSKKAVRINGGKVPFAKGETLTYKFHKVLYDKKKTAYTVAFEFTTSPMPTDKEIVLNPVKADAKFTYAMTADVDPILSVLAVDGAYYPEATINTEVLPLINAFAADANNAASTLKVYKGNAEVPKPATNGYDFDISWKYVAYGDFVAYNEESSKITIPSANIDDKFTYLYEYNVFGVKYTFKVAAEVVKATGYSLSLNSAYVNSDNTVLLNHGTVVYPEVPTKPGTSPIPAGTPYKLQEIDLREYVHVNGETDADNTTTTNELALVYTVLNNTEVTKYSTTTKQKYYGDSFSTMTKGGVLNTHANYASYYQASSVTPLSTVNENIMPLTWNIDAVDLNNEYIGRYNSTITVRIDLVANNDDADKYDFTKQINYGSVTVNLVVPELLEASAIKPAVDKKGNQTGAVSVLKIKDANAGTLEWETVNVVEGLKVTAKNSTKSILYNQEATQLNEFWLNYSSTSSAITSNNVFGNILNQTEVKIPRDQYGQFVGVSARYQTSGATVHPDNYVVDPDGTVKLTANSGEITDNIIVTVPVVFYHDYCSSNHYTEVEVLFVK